MYSWRITWTRLSGRSCNRLLASPASKMGVNCLAYLIFHLQSFWSHSLKVGKLQTACNRYNHSSQARTAWPWRMKITRGIIWAWIVPSFEVFYSGILLLAVNTIYRHVIRRLDKYTKLLYFLRKCSQLKHLPLAQVLTKHHYKVIHLSRRQLSCFYLFL